MTQIYIYGIHPVIAALKNTPEKIQNILLQQNRHDKRLLDVLALADANNIKVRRVAKIEIERLIPESRHQGVLAITTPDIPYHESDLKKLLESLQEPPFLLILDGVQDPHNLGACLRSANAAGIHAVIAPKDNAVNITPVVRKVASGAAEVTPFIQVTNLARTMQALKAQGVWLYGACEDAKDSIYNTNLQGAIALVLGAEGKGLRRLTKENCDMLMSIPMLGIVSSLNVSVAAGICLFEAARQKTRGEIND